MSDDDQMLSDHNKSVIDKFVQENDDILRRCETDLHRFHKKGIKNVTITITYKDDTIVQSTRYGSYGDAKITVNVKPSKNLEDESPGDESPGDETGLDVRDVDLILKQVDGVTRNQAIKTLRALNGDFVEAIIQLTRV